MAIKIVSNKIECNSCRSIIESRHIHDYVSCSCGKVAVDGGKHYFKRAFTDSPKDFTDLSEYYEVHYTESMDGLSVMVNDLPYTTTGKRYIDKDLNYWYELNNNIWVNGNDMGFQNDMRSTVV